MTATTVSTQSNFVLRVPSTLTLEVTSAALLCTLQLTLNDRVPALSEAVHHMLMRTPQLHKSCNSQGMTEQQVGIPSADASGGDAELRHSVLSSPSAMTMPCFCDELLCHLTSFSPSYYQPFQCSQRRPIYPQRAARR